MSSNLTSWLGEQALGGLFVVAESSRDPDLAPFVGRVHLGSSFLIQPTEGKSLLGFLTAMEREEAASTGYELLDPVTLGVEALQSAAESPGEFLAGLLRRSLELAQIAPGRLALAGHCSGGTLVDASQRLTAEGWELVDGRELLLRHRKRKRPDEIRAARQAAGATCTAFRRVAKLLSRTETRDGLLTHEGEGLTAGRLRQEIATTLAEFGLDQPEGNIVAAGRDSGVPHNQGSSERVLRPGESLIIDLFPKGHVFADCTRTFCVGEAPKELSGAHHQVQEALELSYSSARPGTSGWDLQRSVCELLGEAGHATPISNPGTTSGYVHGLGHGVGFEIHEYPTFRRGDKAEHLLEPGDLLTLEPGLYYPEEPRGGYGVRLEDLVLMTEVGPENLTPLPYELDPSLWN